VAANWRSPPIFRHERTATGMIEPGMRTAADANPPLRHPEHAEGVPEISRGSSDHRERTPPVAKPSRPHPEGGSIVGATCGSRDCSLRPRTRSLTNSIRVNSRNSRRVPPPGCAMSRLGADPLSTVFFVLILSAIAGVGRSWSALAVLGGRRSARAHPGLAPPERGPSRSAAGPNGQGQWY